MHKFEFPFFFTLFLSCLVASQGTRSSMYSRFPNKMLRKLVNSQKEINRFDPSRLLIDESRLTSSSQTGRKEDDRIDRLPGQPPNVAFKQYGGYVDVNPNTAKAFYYYFVEAQRSPSTSPLLLWLNGGPGCSSLGYGAMEELGPFRVQSDGKTLYPNDYAWNRVANVLFVESPAGVGFSYSNNVSGGDNQTAVDNYVFLRNWLEKFPEYKTRDVYISGESYAGHYVPQLAQTILHQNKRAKTPTTINLKGIMIGNGVIHEETDNIGLFEYWGSHALISDDLTNQILKHCDFSLEGPEIQKACEKFLDEASIVFKQIDIYNIYGPFCHDSNLTDKPKNYSIFEFDPCSDKYVDAYLNRLDVQRALHVDITKIPYKWKSCNKALRDNWTDTAFSVLPSLKELIMNNGHRIWVFSGDVDGIVPITGTQLSIKEMKLQIKDSWRPWYSTKREVAGYTQVYKGDLTFATVRGSGHQVPMYKPESALLLITNFLKGEKLPT